MNVTSMNEVGTILNNPRSAKEILEQAGLDKEITKRDIYLHESYGLAKKVLHHKALTYGHGNVTGFVSPNYPIVQLEDALSILNPLIKEGKLIPTSAGELRGGKRCFIQNRIDIPEIEVVKGDKVVPFLMAIFDNSGRGADVFFLTALRLSCSNVINRMLRGKDSMVDSVRIIHRGVDPVSSQRQAGEVFCKATESWQEWGKDVKKLAKATYSEAASDFFLKELFPTNPEAKNDRAENTRQEVLALAENGTGQAIPGVKGTYWGLLNGVTEYLDHKKAHRGKGATESERKTNRANNRFESIMFNSSAKKKVKAYNLALRMAEATLKF